MLRACPVAGKQKSLDICNQFIQGSPTNAEGLVFFGVDSTNRQQWVRARAEGVTWYYIDNSYFDCTRGTHFRVTKNALQHHGFGVSDGKRFEALGQRILPMRKEGRHIVVCPQSEPFMRDVAEYEGNWLKDTTETLHKICHRELIVREWNSNKLQLSKSLEHDLRGAWALVTYSSAAAITAQLLGIPTISSAGAAAIMGSDLSTINDPNFYAEDRARFFGVLADNQWTMEEIRMGVAWGAMNG